MITRRDLLGYALTQPFEGDIIAWKTIAQYDYLVVHCSATRADQDIDATEIRRWHRERGWFDIGYHYVIKRDGTVEKGRPDERPGAHARGFNHRSLGICMVGGGVKTPEDNFTEQQYSALRELLTTLTEDHPDAEVLGHRDLPNVRKACPSFDVREWWKENNDGEERNE